MRTVESLLANAVKSVASAILLEHATIAVKPVSNQPTSIKMVAAWKGDTLNPF